MFKKKDKIVKRNKSFFTKAKKDVKFEEEKYDVQEKTYDFYCRKCKTKFVSNIYRYAVTVNGNLNAITKHIECGTRNHRFVEKNLDIIEKLFLNSHKQPVYYPKLKEMKEKYKKRGYERRIKRFNNKDEFEV